MAVELDGNTRCCPQCGAMVAVSTTQRLRDWEWLWSESFACTGCGAAQVVDGYGLLPDEQRLEADVALQVEPSTLLLDVLRRHFALPAAVVYRWKRRLPGLMVRGTKNEMELLAGALSAAGVRVRIVHLSQSSDEVPDLPLLLHERYSAP